MAYSRFIAGMALRTVGLALTIVGAAWMIAQTHWYVTISLVLATALAQIVALVRFATQSSREVARFLDAISFDDTSQSFSGLLGDSAHSELGAAMTRVLTQLRVVRSEREEQARYFQTLIAHVPVALISADERGGVQLLNVAARRLFGTALSDSSRGTVRHSLSGWNPSAREPPRSYGWSGQPALCSSR
jgi:PAS domain-containing protein